jgi:hypothetical protein
MVIIGVITAAMVLATSLCQFIVYKRFSVSYGAVQETLSELRSEVRAATESVREAGQRAEDRFSADVSELLNYNYLK